VLNPFDRTLWTMRARLAACALFCDRTHDAPTSIPPGACLTLGASASSGFTLAIAHSGGDRVVLDCLRERRPPFNPDDVVCEYATTLDAYGIVRRCGQSGRIRPKFLDPVRGVRGSGHRDRLRPSHPNSATCASVDKAKLAESVDASATTHFTPWPSS